MRGLPIGCEKFWPEPDTDRMYTSSARGIIDGNGRPVMIHLTHGDILKQDADALVNTVNCVGVMGRGIALQFRRAFEDNYEAYRKACLRKEVSPGRMFVFERSSLDSPRWIINFPTKRHWKGRSRLEDIRVGLV